MAETMTYDAGTDTITTSETLNPDEQEALKVGEEMEQQQESLLAGKYKNAQELEKAYAELEQKLGEQSNETESKAEEVEEEAPTEIPANHTIISEASNEFFEKGELTSETMAKFENMSS